MPSLGVCDPLELDVLGPAQANTPVSQNSDGRLQPTQGSGFRV